MINDESTSTPSLLNAQAQVDLTLRIFFTSFAVFCILLYLCLCVSAVCH